MSKVQRDHEASTWLMRTGITGLSDQIVPVSGTDSTVPEEVETPSAVQREMDRIEQSGVTVRRLKFERARLEMRRRRFGLSDAEWTHLLAVNGVVKSVEIHAYLIKQRERIRQIKTASARRVHGAD